MDKQAEEIVKGWIMNNEKILFEGQYVRVIEQDVPVLGGDRTERYVVVQHLSGVGQWCVVDAVPAGSVSEAIETLTELPEELDQARAVLIDLARKTARERGGS